MIKSLSNITDISVIDQNEKGNILSFSKIQFNDDVLGSGGFGSVHNVISIDGIQNDEFVLKIFTDQENKQHAYDVIKILHNKLKKRQLKTGTLIYHDLPELLGLPFLVFKGFDNISEDHCVAFLMYNLEKLDYEDFGGDTTLSNDFKELSIPDKLYLAYQLTKTIDFLHQIDFIHADLSENSLWFNSKRKQLSIIDFDSGYHFDSQDKPTTIGKVGHWIGSRFRNIIGQKKDSSDLTTLDRLYEEYWVLANATFEVVFGAMPFFFLSDSDDNTKQSYLGEFVWPNIDYSSPLFNKSNTQQHQAIVSFIEQLENAGAEDLINAFKVVFNKGYKNETKRLSSKEWKDLLFQLNQAVDNNPLINQFSSDKSSIKQKNEEVNFSFSIQRYNSLYLNDVLVPLHENSKIIPIKDSVSLSLKAINDFNIVEEFIEIKALKVKPKIIRFEASKMMRDSMEPIILKWEVENARDVFISSFNDAFPIKGTIEIEPKIKTTYVLTVNGFFDEKINKEIVIDVVSPTIKSFTWEVNLNEGIDNVDLKWETENAERVTITPNVNDNGTSGLIHVPINEATIFKLTAKGLFMEIEKEITAHPFPVPIIRQIFAEVPKIETNLNIDLAELKLPKELFSTNSIHFSNSITFNDLKINSTELSNSLEFPKFKGENALIDKFSKKITLNDLYVSVLEKIYKGLNK